MTDVSLRDYFAARALPGLLGGRSIPRDLADTRHVRGITLEELASDAYAVADAMLLERANPTDNVRFLQQAKRSPGSNDAVELLESDVQKNSRE
jgi:hypothetical protein